MLSIEQAIAQYLANSHTWFGDIAKAKLAYEAINTLLVRRPAQSTMVNSGLTYHDLSEERKEIATFLKAYSRSRNGSFSRAKTML